MEKQRLAGTCNVREWHRRVERQFVERGADFGGQSNRVHDVKFCIEGRRGSDRTREWRWECAERDDDGARSAERGERLLLYKVSRVLRSERVGE
jgi:hypothetical protein